MDKGSILVTGGAGFIGSHVCEALVSRKDRIICIDNLNDYYSPEVKERNIRQLLGSDRFKFHNADIRDFSAVKKIFEECMPKKIIHIAAMAGIRPSIERPLLYEDVNVKGTLNMLELAKSFGVKKFVFASSSSVYGNSKKIPFSEADCDTLPVSPYGATKKAGELLCHTYHHLYDIDIACLRFFTVYGPRGRPDMAVHLFTKSILEGKEIRVFGNGGTKRDYTHISDITPGVIAALDATIGYEIINLGNSSPVELKRLIALIEDNAEKKARIKWEPEQPGDVKITYADISKATKLLGFRPRVKIEEGIKDFVRWYKNGR